MVSELRSAKWAKGWEGSRGESRLLLEHTEIAESLQPWRSWRGTMMLQEDLILSDEASQDRFPCGLKGAGFSQLFFDDSPSQAGWENGVWPFRVVEMSNLICVCVCVCVCVYICTWPCWVLDEVCELLVAHVRSSSLIRDRTQASYVESIASQPLGHQGKSPNGYSW